MTNLDYGNILNAVNESAAANTAKSQAFAREQMQFNAEQAALNRSWQENMSNTAHQREVKDLLAAGLNPILSSGGLPPIRVSIICEAPAAETCLQRTAFLKRR